MRHILLHNFSLANIEQALEEVDKLFLRRYDNPFESKSFLEDKTQLVSNVTPALCWMFNELQSEETCMWVQRLLDIPIEKADFVHYGGLFVYEPGDYLEPHVDAGVHPRTNQRKVATACLYLTQATLSAWAGDSCVKSNPEVWLEQPHIYTANQCVLFANDDMAWHGVPKTTKRRIVLTVSYMAPLTFEHPRYKNTRTRAYFGRRAGANDGLDELREQRASEEGHTGVYRHGANLPDHEQH